MLNHDRSVPAAGTHTATDTHAQYQRAHTSAVGSAELRSERKADVELTYHPVNFSADLWRSDPG